MYDETPLGYLNALDVALNNRLRPTIGWAIFAISTSRSLGTTVSAFEIRRALCWARLNRSFPARLQNTLSALAGAAGTRITYPRIRPPILSNTPWTDGHQKGD